MQQIIPEGDKQEKYELDAKISESESEEVDDEPLEPSNVASFNGTLQCNQN